MSQIRLRDYKEPLTSFHHNLINLLVNKQGRFGGFDTFVPTGTLSFNITHAGTNFTYKDEVGDIVGPIGILLTPQGVKIVETAAINGLSLDSNGGNATYRIDLLVCSHRFLNIDGGQVATYEIVKGPIASFTEPALTDPLLQTIVGRFIIPPNATNLTGVRYKKAKAPDSGDGEDARISEVNQFKSFQQFGHQSPVYTTEFAALANGGTGWDLREDGNGFSLSPAADTNVDSVRFGADAIQPGSEFYLLINDKCTIREGAVLTANEYLAGFAPIVLGNFATGIGTLKVNLPGEFWLVKFIKIGAQYWVTNVVGKGFSNAFQKGMSICLDLTLDEINDEFNDSGLGTSGRFAGWALNNGNNGTVDKRARFTVMATNIPSAGANTLNADILNGGYNQTTYGGLAKVGLSISELPKFRVTLRFNNDQGGNRFGTDWMKKPPLNTVGNTIVQSDEVGGDQKHENNPCYVVSTWIQRI